MTFIDTARKVTRKRLYYLKCSECSQNAIREVWFSDGIADFAHFCLVHWEKFSKDGEYVSVYMLRS